MKNIKIKNLVFVALLALISVSSVGCVVADRPYYYGPYPRAEFVRPLPAYRYLWNRDYYRWHRDHDRWDRD